MQDHYEINVAQQVAMANGTMPYIHLFATAPRSAVTWEQAEGLLELLQKKFPAPQFEVSCTKWTGRGTKMKLVDGKLQHA